MIRIYYGIWRVIYNLAWPIRFLIELAVILLLLYVVWLAIRMLCRVFHIKEGLVKLVVWMVIEFDGWFGRNTTWATENDEKISNWGRKMLDKPFRHNSRVGKILTSGVIIVVIGIYILAIVPDLPFSKAIHSYYLEPLSRVKKFCQQIEAEISDGCEQVPDPVIPVSKVQEPQKGKDAKKQKKILIHLTKVGKKGAEIHKKPSKKAAVLGRVKSNQELVYKLQYKKNGKGYWFKVYLPEKKKTGWINSQYIKKKQIKKIVK